MNAPPDDIYEFDEFRVDAVKRLLTKRGEVVPLAPKAFETLLFLVRHAGRLLDKDELMNSIWTDTIVEDNNLNQSIANIRRALGEKRDEHRFIVTVPGRGYKFVAPVRVSSTDLQAPDYHESATRQSESNNTDETISEQRIDLNPSNESVTESASHARPRPESAATNRLMLAGLIILSIFALGAIGIYLTRETAQPPDAPIKNIAVLPFKPLIEENRNEALELGMADTLITKLSGGENLVVRPLDSVRRLTATESDSLKIGQRLETEAILEGSIQTSGDRIRISARLVRTSDGKQLWAEQFDEKFTDIFAVQDSISQRVAAALQTRLGSGEKKRQTENVEAYQLYMKGRVHASRLVRSELEKGIVYYQQAIAADPNYALAYVGMSNAYRSLAVTSDVPSDETMPKAKAAGLRAVELDPNIAEGQISLGAIAFWYEWDWEGAEKHYRRALELSPNNANARRAYAHLLSNTARHEQALAEVKRGRELDPVTLSGNALEGQFLFYGGKPDEALDRLNQTIDLDPNFWLPHLVISRVYAEKGMHAQAAAEASKARELSKVNTESLALAGYSLAKSGETVKARAVLDELQKLSRERYVPPYNFALVYNALGETGRALEYLEKGLAERDVRMVFLKIEPKWNNLRNEPRFQELMRRIGFP